MNKGAEWLVFVFDEQTNDKAQGAESNRQSYKEDEEQLHNVVNDVELIQCVEQREEGCDDGNTGRINCDTVIVSG